MQLNYVAVDLETTGLDPKRDKIIEVGAVRVTEGRERAAFHRMVNPGRRLDPRIVELTGITDQMAEKGAWIEDILEEFLDFCGSLPLVGHCILFDYSFLKRAAVNKGLSFEKTGVDTLKLCRKFMPSETRKSLEAACAFFEIGREGAHRALGDARDASRLYLKLAGLWGDDHPEAFSPVPLIYKAKRDQQASKKQKEDCQAFLKMSQKIFNISPD